MSVMVVVDISDNNTYQVDIVEAKVIQRLLEGFSNTRMVACSTRSKQMN